MVEQTKTFEKVILVSVGCSFIAMLHILLLTDWYFDIQSRMSLKIWYMRDCEVSFARQMWQLFKYKHSNRTNPGVLKLP